MKNTRFEFDSVDLSNLVIDEIANEENDEEVIVTETIQSQGEPIIVTSLADKEEYLGQEYDDEDYNAPSEGIYDEDNIEEEETE